MFRERARVLLTWSITCLCVATVTQAAEIDGSFLPAAPFASSNAPAVPTWAAGNITPVSMDQSCAPQNAVMYSENICHGCPNCQGQSKGGCCESCPLFGCIAPSDECFSDFISPITNPLFFEDPRTLTEIRPIYASHWIPNSNAVFQGGNVQYLAAQVRIALTERLSIIATKDGFIWINSDNEAAVPDDEGWADVAAGLKYNLIRDPAGQFLLSAGLTFELDAGEHQVFQGQGDGEFHFFATSGKALSDRSHWLSAAGYRQPTDTTKRSTMFYWSNHLDVEVIESWYALIEANWFHWTKSGENLGVNFEGGDLFNLGSTDVAGNDIVTLGVGGRKRFGKMNELGAGYEFPVTSRKDLLEGRLYADVIFRY
ncbi:MAG: hypothetical protein AB7O26_07290 [Planctomycetaceae bacterium]